MTDTPFLQLGPYRQGEIPPPLSLDFTNQLSAGTDITGFLSRLEYRRWGTTTVVERTPSVDVGTSGWVTYVWAAADFAAAGDFLGECWIGNGINRFASIKLRWFTEPAIAVPSL